MDTIGIMALAPVLEMKIELLAAQQAEVHLHR